MALTTLCPQCKAVCAIPDSAMGLQVACSRCNTIFTAAPFVAPKKLQKRSVSNRLSALAVFLILVGISGTVAIVVASLVFCAYRLERAFYPPEMQPPSVDRGVGVMGFGMIPAGEVADDKNGANEGRLANVALLNAPPSFAIPAAVDQQIDLSRHLRIGEFDLALQTWLQAEEKLPDGSVALVRSRTLAELAETVQAVDSNNQASVRLRYKGYAADAARDGASRTMPLAAAADLARARAFFLLNEKGDPTADRLDPGHAPDGADATVKKVHETQRLLFEFFALPLPNDAAAKVAAEWAYRRVVPFQLSDDEACAPTFEAKAIFRGVQRSSSAANAVIEIKGKLKGPEQANVKEARGWALIDVATGTVMQAQVEIPFALSLTVDQSPRQLSGTLWLCAQRRVPPPVEEND